MDNSGNLVNAKPNITTSLSNIHNCSDADLLSILAKWTNLQKGLTDESSLLARFGSFPALLMAPKSEMQKNLHFLDKDIAILRLLYEISLRSLKSRIYRCDLLKNKKLLINYLKAFLSRLSNEHFYIYYLNEKNKLIQESLQGMGTVNTTSVYLREVTHCALLCKAKGLILVHNHPSGITKPSQADQKLTNLIIETVHIVGVTVHDHLIIGNGHYFSFAEQGLIQRS